MGGAGRLVTIRGGEVTETAPIALTRHIVSPLPEPLAEAVALSVTNSYTAATVFPAGATAAVQAFTYTYAGETIDTLRLYLPLTVTQDARLPLLFMVYPTHTDGWEPVSVALASQGYVLVAVSPVAGRGMDIDAHAQDARVAFALARSGDLSENIGPDPAIALGGSFSSPILHRFLRDERDHVAAWITVGGISNAFSAAADFYAGRIQVPPQYELAIPALGFADLFPLTFLRYSPVYTAEELPPTMVIHTASDHITSIDQAYQLEAALKAAGVPVEAFYYEDVSHYLQIGEDLTDAGKEMFYRILDFIRQYQPAS
jgi:acetyl esterase/lipase